MADTIIETTDHPIFTPDYAGPMSPSIIPGEVIKKPIVKFPESTDPEGDGWLTFYMNGRLQNIIGHDCCQLINGQLTVIPGEQKITIITFDDANKETNRYDCILGIWRDKRFPSMETYQGKPSYYGLICLTTEVDRHRKGKNWSTIEQIPTDS